MRGVLRSLLRLSIIVLRFFGVELALMRRAVPPPGVDTFDEFPAWRPGSRQFCLLNTRNGEFLEASGPGAGLLLPSGLSAFVFDKSGRMVDRTIDGGDDSRFQDAWRGTRSPIVRAAAQAWFEKPPTSRPVGP